jgi:IclR helix-turn-helix domain
MAPEILPQHRDLLDAVARLDERGVETSLAAVADVAGLPVPEAATLLDHLEAAGLVYKMPFVSAHPTMGVPSTVTYGISASGRRLLTA